MNTPVLASSRPDLCTRQGFALVIVLVILSLMAIIAVGYLASMASDRATANAFSNKTRAEQAAQAGVDTAIGTLRDYFKAFPDSATVWDTAQGTNPDGSPSEGTTLYLHAVPQQANPALPDPLPGIAASNVNADYAGGNGPNNVVPSTGSNPGADNRQTFVLPLVSGTSLVPGTTINPLSKKSPLPIYTADTATTAGNSVNINAQRQLGDTQGWLGTPPGYTNPKNVPKPVSAPWVYISQADPGGGTTPASYIGRYAFWVEDESFRANVNHAGLGVSHARRDNASNYTTPQTFSINPTDVDLLGLLNFPVVDSGATTEAQSIFNARQAYPAQLFPDPRAFGHAGEANPTDSTLTKDIINKLRYVTTTQSSALNLSRHGTQRLNLNRVVPQPTPVPVLGPTPTPTPATIDPIAVKKHIDQIVKAIQFHAPNFGQRFYRTSATAYNDFTVPDDANQYQLAYLYKVAANIHDYIDKDPIPTLINSNKYVRDDGSTDPGGTIRYGTKSLHAFYGPGGSDGANEIWAQGKDSAPFIEESAMRCRGGHLTTDPSKYMVGIDYYIEVWNPSNQDVVATDLGPNPVLRVANPTQWISTSPVDPTLTNTDPAPAIASPYDSRVNTRRDYDIDLSNVTFKAGAATVITTDPDFKDVITDTVAQANVKVCGFYPKTPDPKAVGKRIYNGTLPLLSDKKTYAAGMKMVWGYPGGSDSHTGQTSSSDYDTELILETDKGVIDCMEGGLPIYNGGSANVYLTAAQPPTGPLVATLPVFGGSLRGNNAGTGYPAITGDPRSNNEQIKYTLYSSGGTPDQSRYFNAVGSFTLGLPNTNFVKPEGPANYTPWPDYYAFPSAAMTATNAPAVIANSALTSIGQLGDVYDPMRVAPTNIPNARGGGRTFKIGQHDDRWDGDITSASHGWTSWRLTDFFGVSDVIDQPGLININGIPRDNGDALRAALTGLNFQNTTTNTASAQLAGNVLPTDVNTASTGLQEVIDQVVARLATTPPATYSKGYTSTDNTGSGPFFERGELSELPAFNRNAPPPNGSSPGYLVAGVNPATVLDRGREELFRRLVEMITTRGNVFTVYAVGQAITPVSPANTAPKRVIGTNQLRVTFKLMPKNGDGTDFHPAYDNAGKLLDLDPTTPNTRFTKPDHYDVQVLSTTSGNG